MAQLWSSIVGKGNVSRPIETVFGILGGIGTHLEDLVHMKRTADRLFGLDVK
jgi:hypothetical protein